VKYLLKNSLRELRFCYADACLLCRVVLNQAFQSINIIHILFAQKVTTLSQRVFENVVTFCAKSMVFLLEEGLSKVI